MDRQPLVRAAWLWCVLGAGCSDDATTDPAFDGPTYAAVLHPDEGGPFEEPVGFVASSRSGRIAALDLKHGRFLAVAPAASFLRSPWIALGRDRVLTEIAVYAPSNDVVTLFAGDAAYPGLLEVPWIVGAGPDTVQPEASDVTFDDADGNGDEATLEGLVLRAGSTTTEDWILTCKEDGWEVWGSRSGRQPKNAETGAHYLSGWRELEFTITGTASPGDRITLGTDTGVVEHDVGGVVEAMALAPDRSVLVLSVWDGSAGSLVAWDPAGGVRLGEVRLPEGAHPWRMDWDDVGERVFVADASLPLAWEVAVDGPDPSAWTVTGREMPAPVVDLAWIAGDFGERLAVAPEGLNRVDLLQLDTDEWVDANPITPEVEGVDLSTPVTGMASAPLPVPLLEETEWGAHQVREVVAVSLLSGRMVLVQATDGCLAQDEVGPHNVDANSSSDFCSFDDQGSYSDPYLWEDETTGWQMVANACAGVAQTETWTLTYDEVDQAWRVEGSRSGVQQGMAHNDERYVSDGGEVSFTIMSGVYPATDGDAWTCSVEDGVLGFSGDLDRDDDDEYTFAMPGRPAVFWYDTGPTGGGWDPLDRRSFMLWPITGSDLVGRVRLSSGQVEVVWR
ncbi:MAG: hypothetical protein JXB39_09370 [Deltaproteobacteria bacterium]|nr:hypothetical protein [Deltaproteobacteria bacterium]